VTPNGILQIVLYFFLLLAVVKPLGLYMANVYEGKPTPLDRVLRPVERAVYRLCGVRPDEEMGWRTYTVAMLLFKLASVLFLYALLRLGDLLPLNPQGFAGMSPDLAFNTAVSFVTNTNWQNYAGESTLGYLPQMAGLTVQNFLSAAAGMAAFFTFWRRWPSFWPWFWRARAWCRPWPGPSLSPYCNPCGMSRATWSPSRSSPWDLPRRRWPSSTWEQTAAASSAPTPPTHLKTRRL
jgi:hypothetical protein